MTKVCHLSTAHSGLDSRIFHKECVSLAAAGFETHLVVSASHDEVLRARELGVTLHPLPEETRRFARVFRKTWRCWKIARSVDARIYHFHDIELFPVGIALSAMRKKVIYDAHEDYTKDILNKHWIYPPVRKIAAWVAGAVESCGAKIFSSVVVVAPSTRARFEKYSKCVKEIRNYPRAKPQGVCEAPKAKSNHVCYIGTISFARGIKEICQAVELAKASPKLYLAGQFTEPNLFEEVSSMSAWAKVDFLGMIDHQQVAVVLERSIAGLVTLHPTPSFMDALPIKIFEYMQAGIPVISSNFPLWREIVEFCQCGVIVDPLNTQEIAHAIDYLIQNPKVAEQMGRNGQKAALETFCWQSEEKTLIALYRELERS